MATDTLSFISEQRCRSFQEFEAWMAKHRNAMFARDIEANVALCVEGASFIRWLLDAWYKALADGEVSDCGATFNQTMEVFDVTLSFCGAVDEAMQIAQRMNYEIDNGRHLAGARASIKQMREEFRARWPTVDVAMFHASGAAYDRGEHQSAKEILDELHCQGSSADQG